MVGKASKIEECVIGKALAREIKFMEMHSWGEIFFIFFLAKRWARRRIFSHGRTDKSVMPHISCCICGA